MNKVMLVGNLGKTPEIRHIASGTAVCDLRLATNESYKDKEGHEVKKTEWHDVVVWGKQAENCSKYLKKGRKVYVEGKLSTRVWEDSEGNKRYSTEVIAFSVKFL